MFKKYIENNFIKETQSVVCTVNGFLDIDTFKDGLSDALEIMVKYKGHHLILDVSEMKVLPDEIIRWMKEFWYASVSNAQISHVYFITPRNIFGKMSIQSANKLVDTFKPKITVSYHSDINILLKELSELSSSNEVNSVA